jgi:predicted Rossmann-fold nucleotide-binding protein
MSAGGGGRGLSICVFCGSAESPPQVFVDAARHLGEEIGRRGHRLVYGGTPGLMGVVARAVQASGGPVVGVVPRGLLDHLAGEGALFGVADFASRGIDLVERRSPTRLH